MMVQDVTEEMEKREGGGERGGGGGEKMEVEPLTDVSVLHVRPQYTDFSGEGRLL